jgi:hypothetical protein
VNEQFLAAVFRDIEPGTHASLVGFPGDPDTTQKWAAAGWVPGERLPRRTAPNNNNYVAGCTFRPNAQGERWQRGTHLFAAQRLIMVDDVGTGVGSKIGRNRLLLPPSALIESSRDNYQADYFITQDADAHDGALCGRLIKQLITHGLLAKKDPGMNGVNRVARLPVGINGKPKHMQGGQPWRVRCIEFEPLRHYTVRQIAAAWDLALTKHERKAAPVEITIDLTDRAGRQFDALLRVFTRERMYKRALGDVHPGRHEVSCPWIEDHTDRADSGTYLDEPCVANNFEGAFVCFHGHCDERRIIDVRAWWWDRQ